MKSKEYIEALKNFEELNLSRQSAEEAVTENERESEVDIEEYDKDRERRNLTYKIEDNVAELMNYSSIISKSKKSLKWAKKDYAKAKKEYDTKSFGALLFDILTFLGAFFSVYFLVKYWQDKESWIFETLLYVSLIFTAFAFLVAVYKNFKIRPYRKKMKRAKELMQNSKIWIDESERGMKNVEDENRSLKRRWTV